MTTPRPKVLLSWSSGKDSAYSTSFAGTTDPDGDDLIFEWGLYPVLPDVSCRSQDRGPRHEPGTGRHRTGVGGQDDPDPAHRHRPGSPEADPLRACPHHGSSETEVNPVRVHSEDPFPGGLTMRRRALGASGIEVSAIGLGCWGMSGSYGPADEAESVATLHHALDLGVDFIDTADSYGDGHNESLIGRALGGSPPRVRPGVQDRLGQAGRAGRQRGRRRRWPPRAHPLGMRGEPRPTADRRDRPLLPPPGRSRRARGGVGRGDERTGRRREGPLSGAVGGLRGHAAAGARRPPDHGASVGVLAVDPRAGGDRDARRARSWASPSCRSAHWAGASSPGR